MKLLTGLAIGLSTVAKYTTKGVVGTYNYVADDVKSVPNGFKAGWKSQYDEKLESTVTKFKVEPKE